MNPRPVSRCLLPVLAAFAAVPFSFGNTCAQKACDEPQPYKIEEFPFLRNEWGGIFAQTRGAVIPGNPQRVIVTAQDTDPTVTHGFRDLYMLESIDNGRTWTKPVVIESLKRKPVPGKDYEFVMGDVCPQWHAATGLVLATGKTFGFRGGVKEDRGLERVSYAVLDPKKNTWSELRLLEMPERDHEGKAFLEANAGCNQRFDLPNGEILLPIRYRKDPKSRVYTTIVARCRFNGEKLVYIEHGSEFDIPQPRGLYEPSVTGYKGKFYLTMRAEHTAFVARGGDGVNYEPLVEWKFDDGAVLGSYNTQQHWIAHSDGLYLTYTRRGANNDHVFRHRAPIFIARVDPEKLCVMRSTERVLIAENKGDLGGGFGVIDVSPGETWVMAAETPPNRTPDGNRVVISRIIWKTQNRLVAPFAP